MTEADCSPGEHQDRRNFTLEDYLLMCRNGEAEYTVAEAARVMGVSRSYLYRAMIFASVSTEEFEAAMEHVLAKGLHSSTALADEIKRRTGKAKKYVVRCPHCGRVIRERTR